MTQSDNGIENELLSKLMENCSSKLDSQLDEWNNFNSDFMKNLENPPIPENLQKMNLLSTDEKEFQLEQNLAYLRFNGLEKLVATSSSSRLKNKKLSAEGRKMIEKLEEEEINSLGGREDWFKSMFGLGEYDPNFQKDSEDNPEKK